MYGNWTILYDSQDTKSVEFYKVTKYNSLVISYSCKTKMKEAVIMIHKLV